jgi:hypothetical protein
MWCLVTILVGLCSRAGEAPRAAGPASGRTESTQELWAPVGPAGEPELWAPAGPAPPEPFPELPALPRAHYTPHHYAAPSARAGPGEEPGAPLGERPPGQRRPPSFQERLRKAESGVRPWPWEVQCSAVQCRGTRC